MALKISTDVLDYMARMQAVSVENDIVLLQSDTYRGLFTIGTDQNLYVYEEQSGEKTQFRRRKVYAKCSRFAATRMGQTEYFAMALIGGQTIYTCVTDKAASVTEKNFHKLDFSGVLGGRKLTPVNLFVNSQGTEATIAVMMKNETGKIDQFIAYFTADRPTAVSYYVLAADFQQIRASVCGRADKQPVDGVYTLGTYSGSDQFLYTPVTNIFSESPPDPIRLAIPGTGLTCIGTCQLRNRQGTHVFGIGKNKLYLYPYEKQHDYAHISGSNFDEVLTSDYFAGAVKISAYIDTKKQKMYVWVLNKSGRLSYTFARLTADGKCGKFAEPMVFRDGIVFFSVTPAAITICTKKELIFGTRSAEDGSFDCHPVSIQTDTGESVRFQAFVTKIITEHPMDKVRLTAPQPVEAYINQTYYRFTDLTVTSDAAGMIDVVQHASDLNPPPFQISVVSNDADASKKLEIFAGKSSYEKLLQLNTKEKLQAAQIVDMHGKKTKLAAGLSDKQLKAAAATIASLSDSYAKIQTRNGNRYYLSAANPEDGFWDDLGYYLEEAWNYVCDKAKAFWNQTLGKAISFVVKVVSDVIHFVIQIGEEVITIVLDTVGKILKCLVKVLEFAGIPVDKILKWLLTFLDIDGAVRMKEMMKYCAQQGYKGLRKYTIDSRKILVKKMEECISTIEKWAGLAPGTVKPEQSSPIPLEMNAANLFLFDSIFKQGDFLHIKLSIPEPPKEVRESAEKLRKLTNGLKPLEMTEQIRAIVTHIPQGENEFSDFLVFLKKLAGLLAVKVLGAAKTVTEAVFDLVIAAFDWLWKVINTQIRIPFISTVLSYCGIGEFSLLDVICIIPAFLINLIFHTATGRSAVSKETLENVKKKEFPMPPAFTDAQILWNPDMAAKKAAEWDNDSYHLEEMSKRELPTGAKKEIVTALHWCQAGIYLFDLVYHCMQIGMPEKGSGNAPISYVGDIIEIGINISVFGLSMGCGYGYYSPMDYDSDFPTRAFNLLWFIDTGWSLCCNATSLVTALLVNRKTLNRGSREIMLNISNGISIVMSIASLIFEAWSADNARRLDLSQSKITYNNKTYTMHPEILKTDRKAFLADVIGYCINSCGSLVDEVMGFDKIKAALPFQVIIGVVIGRGVIGMGSVTAHIVSPSLL